MEIQIGVAKINKYASSESGDTLEVVERANGGLSVVLADGQRSGKGAKRISNLVVQKVTSLLAEGVRDGAAARAASDYLFAQRGGKVQSTLNIISFDLVTNTLVITRNNQAPIYVGHNTDLEVLNEESKSVGIYRNTRPEITEYNLEPGLTVIAFSDGLIHAGTRQGNQLDLPEILKPMFGDNLLPQQIADALMEKAMDVDEGRPIDDISVVVVSVLPKTGDDIRRMSVRLPLR